MADADSENWQDIDDQVDRLLDSASKLLFLLPEVCFDEQIEIIEYAPRVPLPEERPPGSAAGR